MIGKSAPKIILLMIVAPILLGGCATVVQDIQQSFQKARRSLFGTGNGEQRSAEVGAHAPEHAGEASYRAAQAALQDRDYTRAVKFLEKAAALGHPAALHTLGNLYALGQGVGKDPAKAAHYWRRAGNRGHAHSQFLLAKAYASGTGVVRDLSLAARWYGKAAWRGHRQGQFSWAIYRLQGKYIPGDPISALAWIEIAGDAADKRAAAVRARLSTRLARDKSKVADRVRVLKAAMKSLPPALFADPPTILYAEYLLLRLGYDPKPVDGIWDKNSRRAMLAFSKSKQQAYSTLTVKSLRLLQQASAR